jgi:DNA-binding transcriptional regulator YdaS (Cro superfamily)
MPPARARSKSSVHQALARAVALFGTHRELAKAAGTTQQSISRALARAERNHPHRISPEIAIGIHRATGGLVTGDQLRPDIWQRPEHVPLNGRGHR